MSFRILIPAIVSLFLFQSIHAQDTIKHASRTGKHYKKESKPKSQTDSVKTAYSKSEAYTKDTTRIHHSHAMNMPKYARDGYVAISGGLGGPGGAFAANAGAASGSVFSISAGFPGIISHLGIAFKFDYGMNGVNQTQYLQSLSIQNGFSNITYSLEGTQGAYSYKTLLTGLYLTYPGKHITIDARILGGVMFATAPAIRVSYNDTISGNNGISYQSETYSSAFAFDIGFDIRYPVLKRFCVMLSLDYLTSSPSFNYISTGAALNTNGNIVEEAGRQATASQSFDLSSVKLGIGYLISAQKPTAPKEN